MLGETRRSCASDDLSDLLTRFSVDAGVNHAQFGDDKRNAPRGDIVASVSFEQAHKMMAQVWDLADRVPSAH